MDAVLLRRVFLAAVLGLVAGIAGAAEPVPAPDPSAGLPRGTLIEKVACAGQPDQAYALYLPSSYTPARRWPILYAFDARGEGRTVAELFRRAAETHGWIVVSSWNTASDVGGSSPMDGNFAAMRALWADTHARFAIDDTRVYAAGYSGTVRFACVLALTVPGSIAGVIGASAGFPTGSTPKKGNPFAFFGTYGDRDFNYYELRDLDRALEGAGVAHRIEGFAGGHEWPPEEIAARAVAWMELQAMRSGLREKAPALVEAEWTADRERARAQAAAAQPADALHTWRAMAAGYAGLRDAADIAEAEREAAALAASSACQKELREREERDRRDKELLARAPGVLARANPGNEPVTVKQIVADLKIPELKARAVAADAEERLSAERLLNTYSGQTGFYLPQSLFERKEYDRAIFMLSIAAEIHPEEPGTWVSIAAAHARKAKPDRKKALEALRVAVDKGFADPAVLDRESFSSLREEEEFQRLRARVAERAAAGGKG